MRKFIYTILPVAVAALVMFTSCGKEGGEDSKLPAKAGDLQYKTDVEGPVELRIPVIERADTYKWYKDGVEVQNTESRTYTANESGKYKVAGVNTHGEGKASPEVTITITEGTLVFTDIPEGTYVATGTPQENGAPTWNGQILPKEGISQSTGEMEYYYGIYEFGKVANAYFFIDFIDGELQTYEYIEPYSQDIGIFFCYADEDTIYPKPWKVSYDKKSRTIDFSGTTEAGLEASVGIVAINVAKREVVQFVSDFYSDLTMTITPGSIQEAPAMSGKVAISKDDTEAIKNMKVVGDLRNYARQ